jgi:hypothetical protein
MGKSFEEMEQLQLIAQVKKKNKFRIGVLPQTQQEWISLSDMLMKWALLPSSKNMKEFILLCGLSWRALRKYAKENPTSYFTEVWHQAFDILDTHRDKPLYNEEHKDYWNHIKYMKPIYDIDINEFELEKKQIAADNAPKEPVVINKYLFAAKEDENVVESDGQE